MDLYQQPVKNLVVSMERTGKGDGFCILGMNKNKIYHRSIMARSALKQLSIC